LSDTIDAHRQLVKAELDASRTLDERIAVLKRAIGFATDLIEEQRERYEAGTVPQAFVLQAEQYRLQTVGQWTEESAKSKSESAPTK